MKQHFYNSGNTKNTFYSRHLIYRSGSNILAHGSQKTLPCSHPAKSCAEICCSLKQLSKRQHTRCCVIFLASINDHASPLATGRRAGDAARLRWRSSWRWQFWPLARPISATRALQLDCKSRSRLELWPRTLGSLSLAMFREEQHVQCYTNILCQIDDFQLCKRHFLKLERLEPVAKTGSLFFLVHVVCWQNPLVMCGNGQNLRCLFLRLFPTLVLRTPDPVCIPCVVHASWVNNYMHTHACMYVHTYIDR